MLHDLSLVWTPSTTPVELANTLAMSAELGYDVVALDHVYQGAVPSTIASPLGDAITAAASSSFPPSSSDSSSRRTPRILHRATVVVSDLTVNHRLGAIAAVYDIVAVRPTTEKAFQAACLSMAEPALISLDLTTYFPFYFKHRACMAAVRRGVHFEVCYGQALRAGGDAASTAGDSAKSGGAARARALFIANLAGLVRATRGRGIVVSSGARAALDLRGPADVVNLLAVWGLAPDRGTEGMAALPRSIVANESLRRRGFRGVVDIVQAASGADGGEKKKKKQQQQQESKTGEGKQQNQNQKQKQLQQQQQQQQKQKNNDQRKRKADDGLGSGAQAKHQQMKKQKKGGARDAEVRT
ncbi:RNA-binding RNA processing protein rpp1 [Sporothrix curviconia]|uniref:RNA-binding RNA processing protein rpp1 n=1 Tax=Sporothrix curviconia TaxID=1260050 RepID=A0ABP0CUM9_9PEZI